MQFNGLEKGFFIFILSITTWAFFSILSSYFSTILWSAILTVIFYPIKSKLQIMLGKKNKLASLITLGIICLIVFIPLTIIISSLAIEMNTVYERLQHKNTHLPEVITTLLEHLPEWIRLFLTEHSLNDATQIQQKFSDTVLKGGQYLAGSAFLIGKGTFGFAINSSIMLYLLFFLLKDGQYLVHRIFDLLPLSNFVKQCLFFKFTTVFKATVKGTIVVAAIQGILGGIAFYIVDISGSILWGASMVFLSLVPSFGLAIVWIPAAFYLFITKQLWNGFFIVSFFIVIVGLVDNFLRPLLVGKDTKIPDYLILITTLGGIDIYGINGFIIGPLIAALFIACWDLFSDHRYIEETGKKSKNLPENKNL